MPNYNFFAIGQTDTSLKTVGLFRDPLDVEKLMAENASDNAKRGVVNGDKASEVMLMLQ